MEIKASQLERTPLPLGDRSVEAQVYSFASSEHCDSELQRNKGEAVAEGGALFCYVKLPPLEEVRDPFVPWPSYRYPHPPTPQLWHIPSCAFEQLLEVTRYFGFPGKGDVSDPNAVFGAVRALVLDFHRRKPLALTQIAVSHILLDLVGPGAALERAEAKTFVEFNKKWFGVREPIREERDKVRNWIKKRFFVIGAV